MKLFSRSGKETSNIKRLFKHIIKIINEAIRGKDVIEKICWLISSVFIKSKKDYKHFTGWQEMKEYSRKKNKKSREAFKKRLKKYDFVDEDEWW